MKSYIRNYTCIGASDEFDLDALIASLAALKAKHPDLKTITGFQVCNTLEECEV